MKPICPTDRAADHLAAGISSLVRFEDRLGSGNQRATGWHPDVIYAHGLTDPAIEARTLEVAPAVFFAHNYYGTCISGAKTFKYPVCQAVRPALWLAMPGALLPAIVAGV